MTYKWKHENTCHELPLGGYNYGSMLYNSVCNAFATNVFCNIMSHIDATFLYFPSPLLFIYLEKDSKSCVFYTHDFYNLLVIFFCFQNIFMQLSQKNKMWHMFGLTLSSNLSKWLIGPPLGLPPPYQPFALVVPSFFNNSFLFLLSHPYLAPWGV